MSSGTWDDVGAIRLTCEVLTDWTVARRDAGSLALSHNDEHTFPRPSMLISTHSIGSEQFQMECRAALQSLTDFRILHLDLDYLVIDGEETPCQRATACFRQGLASVGYEVRVAELAPNSSVSISCLFPLMEADRWLHEVRDTLDLLALSRTA